MSAFLALFRRMALRPLLAEPLRTALTVFAVALGVAVVLAIRLAGDAATGSFKASMDTLSGGASYEITAAGGVDENLLAKLNALPYPLRFEPRLNGFAAIHPSRLSGTLLGLDLIARPQQEGDPSEGMKSFDELRDPASVWVSKAIGVKRGDRVELTINDTRETYTVRGVFDSSERFAVMDIGTAQRALRRVGLVDRIEVHAPAVGPDRDWRSILAAAMPASVEVKPFGSGTEENRKMLTAFRWNLRILSYISLVVGAFLIYNTISISVARRRAEIGIVRAMGGTRAQVTAIFLCESAAIGIAGSLAGLALGRVMAEGAVKLLAATVKQLYVSSTPGAIEFSGPALTEALLVGIAVSLLAALAPAREAALVAPVEAMARGRREIETRLRVRRNLVIAALFTAAAAWASRAEPWNGRPVAGYAAAFLLIFAMALAVPALVTAVSGLLSGLARRAFGIPGLIAARSAAASLSRTSVLVAALATAVAMLVSVGIMVGSFRDTVRVWMDQQLQADLYLRPATGGGANQWPTLAPEVADRIAALPIVRAVDRFRAYDISYRGMPAILGGGETNVFESGGRMALLPGQDREKVLDEMRSSDVCIVSEPFANKHGVKPGDTLDLKFARFRVAGVYYDYSNERGYIILDRKTLLRHMPDPAASNLAVYLKPGVTLEAGRKAVEEVIEGLQALVFSNASLRQNALVIFDRTFAVTWALEAVAIFVAVLGVAGALVSMVIDRRRELGLLRFLGAAAPQIRSLILCEAGLLGLLANAIGLVLGYALSLLLIYVINVQSFGWTIQFHWPVALLFSALSVLYLASIAAGLYPARIATRLNPIEVIHEE